MFFRQKNIPYDYDYHYDSQLRFVANLLVLSKFMSKV